MAELEGAEPVEPEVSVEVAAAADTGDRVVNRVDQESIHGCLVWKYTL